MTTLKERAEALARDAGMQYDHRYSHWIAARGQFEGEQWYAPYYWDAVLNGDGETIYPDNTDEYDDRCADLLQVDADESDAFGLDCGAWILVRQDSQGFVLVTDHPTREAAEQRARAWWGA